MRQAPHLWANIARVRERREGDRGPLIARRLILSLRSMLAPPPGPIQWRKARLVLALEFNCVRSGSHDLLAQAGIGVFERGRDGFLTAARLYDDIEAPVVRS